MTLLVPRRLRRSLDKLDDVRRAVAARLVAHRASGVHDPDLDASLMFASAWLEGEHRRAWSRWYRGGASADAAANDVDVLLRGWRSRRDAANVRNHSASPPMSNRRS